MRFVVVLILSSVLCSVLAEDPDSKDLPDNDVDYEEMGRGHRKRKKRPHGAGGYGGAITGPCGGYGRTFDKLFGFGHAPSNTYVSAPVMNYFFGCGGGGVVPNYPAPAPVFTGPAGGFGGGHNHHHHHHQHGGGGGFGGPGYGPYPQPYNQPLGDYERPTRPLQGTFTAAASGFGSALADYITGGRPKKVYKQFNKSVNHLFRPLYRLLK